MKDTVQYKYSTMNSKNRKLFKRSIIQRYFFWKSAKASKPFQKILWPDYYYPCEKHEFEQPSRPRKTTVNYESFVPLKWKIRYFRK